MLHSLESDGFEVEQFLASHSRANHRWLILLPSMMHINVLHLSQQLSFPQLAAQQFFLKFFDHPFVFLIIIFELPDGLVVLGHLELNFLRLRIIPLTKILICHFHRLVLFLQNLIIPNLMDYLIDFPHNMFILLITILGSIGFLLDFSHRLKIVFNQNNHFVEIIDSVCRIVWISLTVRVYPYLTKICIVMPPLHIVVFLIVILHLSQLSLHYLLLKDPSIIK
jgi:hypothetical protein